MVALDAAYAPWWRVTGPARLIIRLLAGAAVLSAVGCAQAPPVIKAVVPPPAPLPGRFLHGPAIADDHAPPFASNGWAPFARQDAVAIAQREWRVFGEKVDDDLPETRPPPAPQDKPERQPGLWQRVGEYWWTGQDPGQREAGWTGTHNEDGQVFPAGEDGNFAWSAAFISYVMRVAGAGARFPYAPSHFTYINAAVSGTSPILHAAPPQAYAPQPGDLICTGRGSAAGLHFADLPTAKPFPSHCDIVVAVAPGSLTVMGGNVDDAVTEKHVPTTATGMLAGPDGVALDVRYPWFVVLQVLYDAPETAISSILDSEKKGQGSAPNPVKDSSLKPYG